MADLSADEFRAFVCEGEETAFVKHQLFDDNCWLFDQPELLAPEATYNALKRELADHLGIMPREIAIVGSSKYGWSMSPVKGMKVFNKEKSDADIAIVSDSIFRTSWDALRSAYYAGYGNYKAKHAYHVFARSLVLDSDERYHTTYLDDLAKRLGQLNAIVQKHVRLGKPAQYRIYAEWSDATNYHVHGLAAFRKAIQNADA